MVELDLAMNARSRQHPTLPLPSRRELPALRNLLAPLVSAGATAAESGDLRTVLAFKLLFGVKQKHELSLSFFISGIHSFIQHVFIFRTVAFVRRV